MDHETLVRRYIAAYNTFDLDGMLAVLSPTVQFENYSGTQRTAAAQGAQEFRALAEQSSMLFSEREQKVVGMRLTGDRAIVDIQFRARLAADMPNGIKAGTEMRLDGVTEFVFGAGKIVRIVDRSS